jgi:tripartite-type tricarboxylate transporter receptor subunit TctC
MKRTLAALALIGSADVREVIAADDMKSRLVDLGGVPHASTPAQFAQMIDADRKRYAQIIRERKISID